MVRTLRTIAERARAAWLPLALAAVAVAMVALNTLALPAAAPALAWGPRAGGQVFGVASGRGDRQIRNLVSGEVERYLSKMPPDQARTLSLRELQRIRALQRGFPDEMLVASATPGGRSDGRGNWQGGEVQVVALPSQSGSQFIAPEQSSAAVSVPAADAAPRPVSFLVPLGIHRPGLEGVGMYALSLVSFAAMTGLLALLLPARFRTARDVLLTGQPVKPLAVGVLAQLLAALLSLFLVMLVVGGPLAALVLAAMLLLSIAGLVTAALAAGRLLVRRSGGAVSPPLELASGVLAIFVASIVPYLGWPLVIIASSAGIGSLIMTRFGSGEPWSLRALE